MAAPDRIPVRELRNHVSEVLRRVESGETLEVTANNRPVALLVPTRDRPRTALTRKLLGSIPQADPPLRDELARQLTQSTDDIPDPWQQ